MKRYVLIPGVYCKSWLKGGEGEGQNEWVAGDHLHRTERYKDISPSKISLYKGLVSSKLIPMLAPGVQMATSVSLPGSGLS